VRQKNNFSANAWRAFLICGTCLGANLSGGTPAVASEKTRVALVIGNANYVEERVLANPPRDADAVRAALEKAGFTASSIMVTKDLSYDATVKTLKDFQAKALGADVALIYYSGHGIAFNDANYMAPVDVPRNLVMRNDASDRVIHIDEVQRTIAGAKVGIVFWDACRSNGVQASLAAGARTATSATRDLIPEAPVLPGTNSVATFLAFSTNPRDVADDGPAGELSPFTKAVTQRILARGRSFLQMMAAVSDDVMKATRRGNYVQVPEVRFPRMSPEAVSFSLLLSPPSATPSGVNWASTGKATSSASGSRPQKARSTPQAKPLPPSIGGGVGSGGMF